ncbi:GNAT family N-acetyltransferase [Lachnospiraceae bacterium MD1]|uniref:GNAT family N-acetyltransferase n=1 Tax=Variimorphobacter saccharofermentans TaxID=2755051 RepID=A0A839K1T6_9FIRM|nr:GNAT family N-acetyltransferase [Variimorphobacter saccharofermentans]MBB2182949.1 GNAT family N-acetyltransferase [Variimorphobacter saccharofermentans]
MKNDKTTIQSIEEYCINKAGAYEARPFGTYPICYKVMGKIFAQFNTEDSFYKITLKCEPEMAELYRQLYPEIVVRGYHCPPVQQPYWNTIDLYAFHDMNMLYQMIDEAYDAVIGKLSRKMKMQLLSMTDIDFRELDGEHPDFTMLGNNQRDSGLDVIVAYKEGVPVACGAYKMYDEDHAELKCIFTEPSSRNMGLGSEILRRLEAKAKINGFKWCVLETDISSEKASHIFKKAGYQVIPGYGQYIDMPSSLCMERKI